MTADWIGMMRSPAPDPGELAARFPPAAAMAACLQDTVFHGEGDVWTHAGMVSACLEEGGVAELPEARRDALRITAWMHDIAKPDTREEIEDPELGRVRISHPSHAPIGADMAWRLLIDAGASSDLAMRVHKLIRWHQRPTHLLEGNNPLRMAIRFGCEAPDTPWEDLLHFVRADMRGRICPETEAGIEEIDLVGLFLEEHDLLRSPWPFESDHARLCFLRKPGRSPFWTPPEPEGSRMVVLSGPPGSGKDTHADRHLPDMSRVSLDAWRARLRIDPEDAQGRVVQAALEEARGHLRAGRDFVWNATCLTRAMRTKIVGLACDYDARVEIHALELPLDVVRERNAGRAEPVPDKVLAALAARRQPVGDEEAHRVVRVGTSPEIVADVGETPEPG